MRENKVWKIIIPAIVVLLLSVTGVLKNMPEGSQEPADNSVVSAEAVTDMPTDQPTEVLAEETITPTESPTENEATADVSEAPTESSTEDPTETVTEAPTEVPTEASTVATVYTFRNQKLLDQHYEKHGIEMGFPSAAAYEAAASAVVTNPAALHKQEQDDGDFVYYVEATNEFVVLSKDGYIRTYFLPDRGKAYYDKQ